MSTNVLATEAQRERFINGVFQERLKPRLVVSQIADLDTSNAAILKAPYTATLNPTESDYKIDGTGATGTYAVQKWTQNNETVGIDKQIDHAYHVYTHEDLFNYGIMKELAKQSSDQMREKFDRYALNTLVAQADANGVTDTSLVADGGLTKDNVVEFLSNLKARFMDFSNAENGVYLVVPGATAAAISQAAGVLGFSTADIAIRNGFVDSFYGVDIYTTAASQLPVDRYLAGVKKKATVRMPGSAQHEEGKASGKTGKEIVDFFYTAAKVWKNTKDLTISVHTA